MRLVWALAFGVISSGCFPPADVTYSDTANGVDTEDPSGADTSFGDTVGPVDSEVVAETSPPDIVEDGGAGDIDSSASVCPESCPASTTPCKVAQCDPELGACVEYDADDGTDCEDGSACTEHDICRSGACEPGGVVSCTPSGACVDSSSCDPVLGCVDVAKDDGTPCELSSGSHGACQSGACQNPVCSGIACPALTGFVPSCNSQAHCEYRPAETTAQWQEDVVWIHVPPASFPQGAPDGEDGGLVFEVPVHTVTFAVGFFLQKYPVTTRTYEACEAVGLCSVPVGASYDPTGWGTNRSSKNRATHPQNSVTRAQARTVCGWLVPTGRLPTEAEWEYAANGPSVHRKYPWGSTPEPTCENATAVFDDGGGAGCGSMGTWPVEAKVVGVSAVGAYDMAGNVAEWVDDCWHDSYEGAPADGSSWVEDCVLSQGSPQYIQRGGGFLVAASTLRTAARAQVGDYATIGGGVRCVWSPQ